MQIWSAHLLAPSSPMTLAWLRKRPSPSYSPCCLIAKLCPTLQPYKLLNARFPCTSLSPGVCSDSCLLSQWCHPTAICPFISTTASPATDPLTLPSHTWTWQAWSCGVSGREPICQFRRLKSHGFNPWVGKFPRRRVQQFSPGESHGQSLEGSSP